MSKKLLSLKQQLVIEQKKLQFQKRVEAKYGKILTYYEQLRILLPEFESLPPGKQKNFINAKQSIKFIIGGFQSGKTETYANNMIWLSYVNRPIPGISISPTSDNMLTVMKTKMIDICERNGIKYDIKIYTSLCEFFFLFGDKKKEVGKILLGSGQAIDAWIGFTGAFAGIDEPFRQPEATNIALVGRASHPESVLTQINYSGTPELGNQMWGDEITDVGEIDDERIFATTISSRDNFKLRKGYVEDLMALYDEKAIETYIEGKGGVNKGGLMYYMFDKFKNLTQTSQIKINRAEHNRVMIVFDFNINPMTALEKVIKNENLYVIDEYKISGSNTWELTENIISRLKVRYDVYDPNKFSLIITGDRTALKGDTRSHPVYNPNFNDYTIIRELFDKAGIKYHMVIPEHNPNVEQRVQLVNNLFEKRYLWIDEGCTGLINDMRFVKAKTGSASTQKDKSNPKLTHFSDNLDYGCWLALGMGVFPKIGGMGYKDNVEYFEPRDGR